MLGLKVNNVPKSLANNVAKSSAKLSNITFSSAKASQVTQASEQMLCGHFRC